MIVVGATLPAFKMEKPGYWGSWLTNAEEISTSHEAGVTFIAVLELDGRGIEPFDPLIARLHEVTPDHVIWTFTVDDRAATYDSHNRLMRICTGRNLITHFAQDDDECTHVLFADADVAIPGDAIPRLLAVDWPLVGGRVPSYCLSGPAVPGYPDFPVTTHMNTAGFLLVTRSLFSRLRWRIDPDNQLTDDPCYHEDATLLGFPTRVREDVIAEHWPATLTGLEFRGHDLRMYR